MSEESDQWEMSPESKDVHLCPFHLLSIFDSKDAHHVDGLNPNFDG